MNTHWDSQNYFQTKETPQLGIVAQLIFEISYFYVLQINCMFHKIGSIITNNYGPNGPSSESIMHLCVV